MHPGMLLYVGITWVLWWVHIIVIREDVRLVIANKDLNEILTPKRRSWILTAWTIWVAAAKCLRPSLKGLAISGALIMFHSLMRDPSKLGSDIVSHRSGDKSKKKGSDRINSYLEDSDNESEVMVSREDLA